MNKLEEARSLGYAIRTCDDAYRHADHTYERYALDVQGTWNPYTAWCPGNRNYKGL